jgi:hypothetical protein
MDANTSLPLRYARLIVNYTHGLLSEAEAGELDEWICASDENLEIFEHLIGEIAVNITDLDAVIEETDNVVELWVIAGLIARERRGEINETEKDMLAEWIAESEQNEEIYKAFSDPAHFQRFAVWCKQLMQRNDPGAGLN